MNDLSEKQSLAVITLVSGKTRLETAEICGVDESTVFRWLQDAKFEKALKEAQTGVYKDSINELKAASLVAVRTLVEVAQNAEATASARVSASTAILSNCFRAVELVEIQNRLEALQRQLELLGEK